VDNPPVPPAELRTVTIIGLYRPDSPEMPKWAVESLAQHKSSDDFFIACKEWLPGSYRQMRAFQKRCGHEFLLIAPQHPEVRAQLTGHTLSAGDGSFQAYGAQVLPEDKAKLVPRVPYRIQPVNISETYRWTVAPDVTLRLFEN
jgi:hypothetical protein